MISPGLVIAGNKALSGRPLSILYHLCRGPPCRNCFIHLALTFSLTVNCFTLSKLHRPNKRFSPEYDAGVVLTTGLRDASAASLGSARLEISGMDILRFNSGNLSVLCGAVCSIAN